MNSLHLDGTSKKAQSSGSCVICRSGTVQITTIAPTFTEVAHTLGANMVLSSVILHCSISITCEDSLPGHSGPRFHVIKYYYSSIV